MSRIALTLAVGLLAPVAAAQCFESSFGTPLVSGTALGDFMLPIQPIGFAFPLGGMTYSHVTIADKGHVFLSNANVPPAPAFPDYTATAAELASDGPRICALWSDLQITSANGGQIWINSSANRCVVTWQNLACYGGACAPFDVQLQLMASGEVLVFWGAGATNNSQVGFPAWQAGVVGISPGGATLGALSDLSAGGSTSSDLVVEEWPAANSFDLGNRGIRFSPTSPGWTFVQPAGCASTTRYGQGCVERIDSVYEEFAPGTFDLGNTTIAWLRSGSGYTLVTGSPGTFVPPTAAAINIAPLTIDGEQVVTLASPMPVPGGTTTSLNITTKGQIELASTTNGLVDFTPSGDELLAWGRTAFHCWHDFDQTDAGSGLILFEQVGTIAYATWNGVHSYSSGAPNTFQFQLDRATGNVTLVMQAMNGITSSSADLAVVGYSIGGTSFDPGATDLSALTTGVGLFDAAAAALELGVTGRPRLGTTTFTLDTTHVPSLVPLAFLFFGDTQVDPGLDLTFLGMPGCFGYTNANLVSVGVPAAMPAGTASVPLPIPNSPVLVGATLTAQSIAFSPATPLNLISSNGLLMLFGN